MNRNLVEIALQELEAEDRAMLELSVVRGVSDEDIAELLGVDIARVLIKREDALGRISALLDDDPEHVLRTMRGLPEARWRQEQAEQRPEPELKPEPEPDFKPEAEPEGDSGRFMLVLLGVLAVILVVVVVVTLNSDDDAAVPQPAPATTTTAARAGTLTPLDGGSARGTARIEASRLTLRVRGLPPGGYVVWLYNSVTDARPVAGRRQGSFSVNARLPANFRRYRFIDISREPPDGNSNHSGQSVLRVRLAELAR